MTKNYLTITPSGAYQATNNALPDIARKTLLNLMKYEKSPEFKLEDVSTISGISSHDVAKAIFYQLQSLHLIQAEDKEVCIPTGSLEVILPSLLKELSSTGKALLADDQGLHLAVSGFSIEIAEELSAVSGSVLALQSKHARFLTKNMNQKTTSWGIINPTGDSQLGFWPLSLGNAHFILVISDVPRLNRICFRNLIWMLCHKYTSTLIS